MTVKLTLDDLVTSVATDLMGVTHETLPAATKDLLHQLVDFLQVDLSFLRRNDHDLGATILIAEWPERLDIPEPDPLGVIFFATADPTFAALEHLSTVLTTDPHTDDEYQTRIRQGSGIQGVSLATVPLMSGPVTTGTLGFIKYGDRRWRPAEISALRAVAALLAQLQARVAAEEQLRYLAYHDELTGLATRRALADHLSERLRHGAPGPVAIIFLDVDRLKVLNSFFGHAAGDEFLQTLAERLLHASPEDHFLARLGGDEFVAVMNGPATPNQVNAYAELLRQAALAPIPVGGEEISRAVSLGVALGEPGCAVAELMNQADQAMLQAKLRGGNNICLFTPALRERNAVGIDIELHLLAAIATNSLVLHYQPQVTLTTGEMIGVEALVRWPHPHLGLLQPSSFIELAEATNLAGELGRWVLNTSCRQVKAWHDRFPDRTPIGMSVNVSPAELITADFVESVRRILQECGLEGRHLTLEITENAIISDTEQALKTLRGLKEIGVKVAIDDFGTGYSSFAQLKTLPVDELKIDYGFVRDLGHNNDDLAIVRSIIGLADSFGMHTVAEGVETEVAAATLIALGCQHAQGFLYAKPVPAEDIEQLLTRPGTALRHPNRLGRPPS